MERIKLFAVILLSFFVFISCSQSILDNTKSTKSEIEINEDSISKKFYTKNLTKNFTSFLENPTAISSRTAADGLSEECLFTEMWNDLTEEEQNMLLENAANLEVSKDSLLSVKNDSPASRAALNGDTTEIDSIAAIYSYNEFPPLDQKKEKWIIYFIYVLKEHRGKRKYWDEVVFMLPDGTIVISDNNYEHIQF